MKKVSLIFVVLFLVSCGRSKEEQMLYDYQSSIIKEVYNTTPEELDFKINSISKTRSVPAKDSAFYYKEKLNVLWFGEDHKKEESDTLTFEYAKNECEKLIDSYQELILANIRANRSYKNYKNEDEQKRWIDAKLNVTIWKLRHDEYNKNPDNIICQEFKANYSLQNPSLNNVKQTFDRYFYTDADNLRFVKMEDVK